MDIRRHGHLVVAEEVLLATVEIVQRTVDAIVEHGEVEAHVPVLAFFPFEVGVDVFAGAPHLEVFSIVEIVAEAAHGVDRKIASEILVACHAVVGTDFQVVDPVDVFHK